MKNLNLIEQPAEHLSKRYKLVKTSDVVNEFLSRGFEFKKFSGSRKFGQHIVLLENRSVKLNDGYLQCRIRNSFDGSARLSILFGLFRLVCSNGLLIPNFEGSTTSIKLTHVGKINEYVDQFYDKAQLIENNIRTMKNTIIKPERFFRNVLNALDITKITDEQINVIHNARRIDDIGNDAFRVYNRVQELLCKGGLVVNNKQLRGISSLTRDTYIQQVMAYELNKEIDLLRLIQH